MWIDERTVVAAVLACKDTVETRCTLANVGSVMVCPEHGKQRVVAVDVLDGDWSE